MRRLARLLPYLVIVLLLAIAGIVVLRSGAFADHARNLIAHEFSRQLDRDVTIGRASLSLSGRVVLNDVVVRDRDGSLLLKAPQVSARVGRQGSWLPLLTAPTEIREVRLRSPEVKLRRAASGELSIADILEREPERPSRFQGDVYVEDGRLVFADEVRGVTTALEGADITVHYPQPGRAEFQLEVPATEGAFERLALQGESDSETGVTRIEGSAESLNLAYAMARAPRVDAVGVRAGRADVQWEMEFGGGSSTGINYRVEGEVSEAEVVFPWLRRPLQAVAGEVRLSNDGFRVEQVTGTVADAPFTAQGVIADFSAPTLNLDLSVSGIRYPQIRALFPSLVAPLGLALPSPMRITARVEGPASDVTVSGEAALRVLKFRAVPWNDVVARFRYSGGRLKVTGLRAHGSPRRLEAEFEIDLRRGAVSASGEGTLINVPLPMLAQMAGVEGTELEGTAEISVRGRVDGATSVAGEFAASGVVVRGVAIGRVEGRFEYADGRLRLERCAVDGPVGTGSLEGRFSLDGTYEIQARFSTLHLSAAAPALSLSGVSGQCCARLAASGQIKPGRVQGRIELGPGEVEGRSFELLAASFIVSDEQIAVHDLQVLFGQGEYGGHFEVAGWRASPEEARMGGELRVQGAALTDYLPRRYHAVAPAGTIDGSIEFGGTLADPTVALDMAIHSVSIAGREFEAGRMRAGYREHRLVVEEFSLAHGKTQVSLSGQYAPGPGLDFALVAEPVDLTLVAPEARRRYGLALAGQIGLRAHATGPLFDPQVTFEVGGQALEVNGVVFDELAAAGRWQLSGLEIESASLRRGLSEVSVTGRIEPGLGSVDLSLAMKSVELADLQAITHGAVYRLQRAGKAPAWAPAYWKLPSPIHGDLTSEVRLTGPLRKPQIGVSLALAEFAFNGRWLEEVSGELSLRLRQPDSGRYALDTAHMDLEVSHEQARGLISGDIDDRGEIGVMVDIGNLDLRTLGPWLGYPVDIGGRATINFDVSGPLRRPVLRGDVFVDALTLGKPDDGEGGFSLEAATVGPIELKEGVLTLERIRLRKGPMEAIGNASVPVYAAEREGVGEARAELHLADAVFAPMEGMTPAVFDADVYLAGRRLLFTQSPEYPGAGPGVRGQMGSGRFAIGGEVVLNALALDEWDQNVFDVSLTLDGAELEIPALVEGKLDGAIRLATEDGSAVVKTPRGEPLVFSEALLGLPEARGMPTAEALPFAPEVDVTVLVGRDVRFQYGAGARATRIEIQPGRPPTEGEEGTGYVHLKGRLSPEALKVDGKFDMEEGQIAFPNGVLELERGTARVLREAGQFRIMVSAAANGRVGDYTVTLRPSGQIYPFDEKQFDLNAASIPYLDEAYVMTLLVGPVVAPSRGGRQDIAALLAEPGRSSGVGGQVTGILFPPFGSALGMQEVALDVALEGQVRLRIGERFLERFVVSYVSALSGPSESRTLRINYEITPLWSMGWSVNERDRGRWEVQAFVPF